MRTLAGYGYQHGLLSDLEYYAQEQGAIIVDIRLNPHQSRHPFFNKARLQESLGPFYWHEVFLANLAGNDPGCPTTIQDIEEGCLFLERQMENRSVVLLCKCSDWEKCHRKYIMEEMEFRNPGLEVVHLNREDRMNL